MSKVRSRKGAAIAAALLCSAASTALPLPAAAQTSADAIYRMAYDAYDAGRLAEARALALQAGGLGNVRALALAAHLAEHGEGGPEDQLTARTLYQKAGDAGDADAMFSLGVMAREGRAGLAPEDALGYFTRSAELGRKDARVEEAMLYADGAGVERDAAKAREILRAAALDGSRAAQRTLGLMDLTAGATDAQAKEAETWLATAAEAGDAQAAYVLGVSYSTGDILPEDDRKAARYLRIAANAGDAKAMADYGVVLFQGKGVEASPRDGVEWFRKAAEKGDQEGRSLYATALATGQGVDRDLEKAYFWVLRAAAQGPSPSIEYETDRIRLLGALEKALPKDAQDRIRKQVESLPQ